MTNPNLLKNKKLKIISKIEKKLKFIANLPIATVRNYQIFHESSRHDKKCLQPTVLHEHTASPPLV